ncbi:retron Ec78 anti-phage system effector ATPase PtuA [Pseudoalteromonas arctica]|uniref:Endonuclease GajA/Old nuclease/RecF-like AAA domain-containing protein n=1 Tax=Pseudoalteromonas arctica A 37-1-2 TaxID=1117313 RepID=A0A290S850_9GAMM|nr:retron Ec78 anti-phage system effector ATPase PtuA [Pseudoalteromonas arctica]ATC87717.1 hypothetical protein PARC_a3324 [Pseudoalteromonas arctica A 37-1-2]
MSSDFNHDKTINKLAKKAKSGNFFSAIELSNYYNIGRFVSKNKEKSDYYNGLAYSYFNTQSVKLKKIKINNFRLFEKGIGIEGFDEHLNIFVGNNGAGKTSILDAISLSLSWLSISINKNGGSGEYVDMGDINNYSDIPYASVASVIELNKSISASLELSQAREGTTKIKNKLHEFKIVGDFYKIANGFNSDFNMPLLAYYNVMRSYDVNPKDFKGLDDLYESTVTDKFDAYQKSLTGKTDFKAFIKWYKKSDDILNRRKVNNNRSAVLSELGITEETVDFLKSISLGNANAKKSLGEINTALTKNEPVLSDDDNLKRNKEIIDKVINIFMDGYTDIEVQLEPMIDLIIKKNDKKISVMKLSQGEKTLLSLVLDIARRLIILNPSLDNPLRGSGIVLIDEFDLHLHPLWQRHMAKNLINTFPNCQFFLTTHSPIVLSEVDRKHVYILSNTESGHTVIDRPSQTFGLTANEILNELMTPDDISQLVRSQYVEKELEEIFDLLDQESATALNSAKGKINNLEQLLHGDIPELVKAKTQMELIKDWLEDCEKD